LHLARLPIDNGFDGEIASGGIFSDGDVGEQMNRSFINVAIDAAGWNEFRRWPLEFACTPVLCKLPLHFGWE